MTDPDPLHVAARRALLDALEATAPFRRSLIVVGAQAVYLRTVRARLPLQAFTTDGDLVIDPAGLPSTPALEATLESVGFSHSGEPGTWRKAVPAGDRMIDVDVDFLVPDAVAPGSGRRSVELVGHDRLATRRVYGLEAALVDKSPMHIAALDPADERSATVAVAGTAALFIAKVHKIADRVEAGRHQRTPADKDAADIYRLIQATPLRDMTVGFRLALSKEVSGPVTEVAIRRMDELFGRRGAVGVEMAVRAIGIAGESPETIAAVLTAYASELRAALMPRHNAG